MSFSSPSSSSDAPGCEVATICSLHRSLFILMHFLADMTGKKSHPRHTPGLENLVRSVLSFPCTVNISGSGGRPALEVLIGVDGDDDILTLEQRHSIWHQVRIILSDDLVNRLEGWSTPIQQQSNLASIRMFVDSLDKIYSTIVDESSTSSSAI